MGKLSDIERDDSEGIESGRCHGITEIMEENLDFIMTDVGTYNYKKKSDFGFSYKNN